jgi:hypothetical protein
MRKLGITFVCAGVLAATLCTGCARTQQFSGMLRYGNLMSDARAEMATEGAREQLLARAAELGVDPDYADENEIIFRMEAPDYVVELEDGSTERRPDPRIVHAEVKLDKRIGQTVYRYYCWIEGAEPAVFTEEDRARFGLALLALREMLETPIRSDFLGGE